MPRIPVYDVSSATGKRKELIEAARKKFGRIPNIVATMANAPSVLEAYLGFSGGLAKAVIPVELRERIALLVAQMHECGYCTAAHSAIGKMAGLSGDEILEARSGRAGDKQSQAVLDFVKALVDKRGSVSDQDVAAVRCSGFGDEEIIEITAVVLLNLFTSYFNHVAETEVDFPKVPALAGQ